MPQVVIRCQNCGTRQDAALNVVDVQNLQTRGNLARPRRLGIAPSGAVQRVLPAHCFQ